MTPGLAAIDTLCCTVCRAPLRLVAESTSAEPETGTLECGSAHPGPELDLARDGAMLYRRILPGLIVKFLIDPY